MVLWALCGILAEMGKHPLRTETNMLRQRIKKYAQRSLLVVASLLLSLAAFELYLRMTIEFGPDTGAYVADLELGKRLLPHYRGNDYGSSVSINSYGMRDREFDHEKQPSRLRIIALGDSWTFGAGVESAQTWPKQLETMIAEFRPETEVMNTGVSGYETVQEARYYANDLQSFQHDIVLVGIYPVNDIHDKARKYAKLKAIHDISPWLYQAYIWPSKNLYTLHWYKDLRAKLKAWRRKQFYAAEPDPALATTKSIAMDRFAAWEEDWTDAYTGSSASWAKMRAAFLAIGRTARAANVRAAVILFPDIRNLTRYANYCHPRVAPMLRAVAMEAGLEWIDLVDVFRPYAGREAEIALGGNPGSTHPSPAGYRLIASETLRHLNSLGWLSQK